MSAFIGFLLVCMLSMVASLGKMTYLLLIDNPAGEKMYAACARPRPWASLKCLSCFPFMTKITQNSLNLNFTLDYDHLHLTFI